MKTVNLDGPNSFPDGLDAIATPAFVYDEGGISRLLDYAAPLRTGGRCRLLFAIKSFSFAPALRMMAPRLDGFSASSLYEARLARSVAGDDRSVHLTTSGFRGGETGEIGSLCDYVSLQDVSCLALPTLAALKAGINPTAAARAGRENPPIPYGEGLGTGIAP